jgi:hypothetical protein
MDRIKILLVISAFLILLGSILRVYLKIFEKESIDQNAVTNYAIDDRIIDTLGRKNLIIKKWFPVPITSIERSKEGGSKYFIVLENGMGFYTNEHYDMTDTIFWSDEGRKMVIKIPKENK